MAHEPVHSAIYFVNKFCWNLRKLIYLCIINNLFHKTMAEFSSYVRDCMTQKAPNILFGPSQSSPQPFWHQGPVLWKTIFWQTKMGGGCVGKWFKDDSHKEYTT